jgi:hypothetical protein
MTRPAVEPFDIPGPAEQSLFPGWLVVVKLKKHPFEPGRPYHRDLFCGPTTLERPLPAQRLALSFGQLCNPPPGKFQQRLQLTVVERGLFPTALNLDELLFPGHDNVHVDGGIMIFYIIEVQDGLAGNNPHADGSDAVA